MLTPGVRVQVPPRAPEKRNGIDVTGAKPVTSTVSGQFQARKFIVETKDIIHGFRATGWTRTRAWMIKERKQPAPFLKFKKGAVFYIHSTHKN